MRVSNHTKWSRKAKVVSLVAGFCLVAGVAAAATNWVISLNSGSSAVGQAATISNVSITAVSSPSPANLLYPGGTGDAVLVITNSNPYPVTITQVSLPSASTYATGYSGFTSNTFSGPVSGCSSTTSLVAWNYASNSNPHNLASSLTVAGNGTLTVTMTNDVSMSSSSPLACAGVYLDMPSLSGITATGGAATATTSPATDSWTS